MSAPKPQYHSPDATVPFSFTSVQGRREPLEWWNVNLAPSLWTAECPEYLLGQTEKNKSIIATADTDYKVLDWEEVKEITKSGQIWLFGRKPSELRRYEKYCYDLKKKYGSILYYIQHERLGWPSIDPSGDQPFTNSADYRILFNDWPYALGRDVKHLIIWTKFAIGEEDEAGHLTPESVHHIEQYIVKTFCDYTTSDEATSHGVPREHLVWFKNYKSLRSVHALEHLHVLLYKPGKQFLENITQWDIPMSEKIFQ